MYVCVYMYIYTYNTDDVRQVGWEYVCVCVCVCVCVWVYTYDTPDTRQVGWEKTALLVSYFFPEHEELDPQVHSLLVFLEQQYKY